MHSHCNELLVNKCSKSQKLLENSRNLLINDTFSVFGTISICSENEKIVMESMFSLWGNHK